MSQRTAQQYFERAYRDDAQVFGSPDGWYETRKRQVLLASLLSPRYDQVFEPGGGNAALTIPLAERSEQVLMMDWSVNALKHAEQVTDAYTNVKCRHGALPEDWPQQRRFDLIVFSELLYYLSEAEIVEIARLTTQSLCASGEVALLHWRHASADYPLTAAQAHTIFISACSSLDRAVVHEDQDFLLHILAAP